MDQWQRNRCKEAEANHNWEEAARLWRLYGDPVQADICDTIIDAIRKGDRFRELMAGAQEELEAHKIDWAEFNNRAEIAHNLIYK